MPKIDLKQINADLVLQSTFDDLDTIVSGLSEDLDIATTSITGVSNAYYTADLTLSSTLTDAYSLADTTLSGVLTQQIEDATNTDAVKDFSIAMAVAL
ncbi:hypothetical protein H8D85_01745 [bacterium]|nr:hypothetical protein [bacterium]